MSPDAFHSKTTKPKEEEQDALTSNQPTTHCSASQHSASSKHRLLPPPNVAHKKCE